MPHLQFLYGPSTYAVLAAVLALGYAAYRAALPKPLPGIPYHEKSAKSVLGDAPDMVRHQQKFGTVFDWMTSQAAELNSPVFQLFLKPFSRPAVFVTDPRETQDVLLRRAKEFDRSQFLIDTFVGTIPYHHICQPTNDKFRQGRRLLADTMSNGFLNNVAASCLHRHISNLMDLWRVKSNAADGHAFAVAEDISHMALDSIWEVAFGTQLRSIPDETRFLQGITKFPVPASQDEPIVLPRPADTMAVRSMKIITDGLNVITSPLPRQTHWLLRLTPSYRRAKAYKERLAQEGLDDAKSRLLSHKDADEENTGAGEFAGITCATDHMVRRETQAAAKEGRAPRYDSAEAKDELFGFLIGGHETTATTLMWCVKLLTDNPRVQGKLRKILRGSFDEVDGAGVPSPEDVTKAQIPYLDAVVEEVIRCSKTGPAAVRTAVHDTTLLGHRIPKGVDVYMLANGPGYMEPNSLNEGIPESARSVSSQESKGRALPSWNAADVALFQPERWIRTDEGGVEVFDSLAGPVMQFGGGIRGCFGKKLAYLQIRIMIVLLVWSYELKQVPESLRGNEGFDCLTHKPKKCYLVLEEVLEKGQ